MKDEQKLSHFSENSSANMANNSSLVLRLFVSISTFTVVASILFFLTVGHLIAFIGYLLIIWLCSWSFSRYFVEYVFLNKDIVSHLDKAVLVTGKLPVLMKLFSELQKKNSF